MSIIDTHTHIFTDDFDLDIDQVVQRAKAANVEHVLMPNINSESIERINLLADKYNGYALPMMGLHPTSVEANWEKELEIIRQQFAKHKYIAVGEIGLDLYWDKSFETEQKKAFEEQLRWSIEYNLPVSIHSRNATMEAIECIKRVNKDLLRGVFHCFGGPEEELSAILSLKNFLIGINGTVTYKKSTLPDVLTKTDLSHIVIETDAPYLPPVPYRGKRNEPAYTNFVVAKLAEIYNTDIESVQRITSDNAKKMFNL